MRTQRFSIFALALSLLFTTAPGFARKPPFKLRVKTKPVQLQTKTQQAYKPISPNSQISNLSNYTLPASKQASYEAPTRSLAVDEAFSQLEKKGKNSYLGNPEKLVSRILGNYNPKSNDDILTALGHLWRLEERGAETSLFPIFIRQYYSQHFGVVSPHLQKLFHKVGTLQDQELQVRLSKRLRYLVQNKHTLALAALPANTPTVLPAKLFRVRYLADINTLTAENFAEDMLVLSIERKMSPHPEKDLPLRHITGNSIIKIKNQLFPVYQFNAPIDTLPNLYRFLLNGKKKQPFTVVFDEEGQSLALFNHDHTVWIRISPHEYSSPERLHIHVNELRDVSFTNTHGVETWERVNINLSIPLATPADLPKYKVQEFLYHKLIVNPVKFFKGDDLATIIKRPIF